MARIYLSPPELTGREQEFLTAALASGWIAPLGPNVDAFEAEVGARIEGRAAAAVASGTAALHLALEILGVGPGDTVYTPTLTFAASANPIVYTGATPVFIDCDRETWTMSPALVAAALAADARRGRLPRAIITVDLYGQCADHGPILDVAERHGVPVIEDAAEAFGATYRGRPAGAFGAMSILSFNGNKIITTSGGGMLLSERADWMEKARFLSTQARAPGRHYEHSQLGFNYRLSNLLAAVGRAQLLDLDRRVAARRAINARYRDQLGGEPGIAFMPEATYGQCTFWLTCITVDPAQFGASRDDILDQLAAAEIEARPVWKPMHLQPLYRDRPAHGGAVAQELFEHGLCLPSGSALRVDEIDRICAEVRAANRRR